MFKVDDRNGIAVLRMEHGKVNALDVDVLRALVTELAGLGDAPVVLTGTGAVFSAGADLARVLRADREYTEVGIRALTDGFRALFLHPRPVVAAVNGHAIAGGCVLVCACDYRVMTSGPATIGLAELRVGVPFPTAALEVVRAAVGARGLQALLYLGDNYPPAEALTRGLVDEVVEPEALLDRAVEVAERLGRIPAESFAHTKAVLRAPFREAIERRGPEQDPTCVDIWSSEPVRAAIAGFMESLGARR